MILTSSLILKPLNSTHSAQPNKAVLYNNALDLAVEPLPMDDRAMMALWASR